MTIISDKTVKNFEDQYDIKRYQNKYTSNVAKEANVAGLEAMGTTYDVTQISQFFKDFREKIGNDASDAIPSPERQDKYGNKFKKLEEWSVWLTSASNPYDSNLKNWRVINPDNIRSEKGPYNYPADSYIDGSTSYVHLHTEASSTPYFSSADSDQHNRYYNLNNQKNYTFWVGRANKDGSVDYKFKNINFSIIFDSNNFKNAK